MSTNSTSRFKKSVTFHENYGRYEQSADKCSSKQILQCNESMKSEFTRRKLFNIQDCKFMSMRNINRDLTHDQSYSLNPVLKLSQQIFKMEDNLAKTQRSYVRKIKNLGRTFNKQCQKQIKLTEQVMELRNELRKNMLMLDELRSIIGKQNLNNRGNSKGDNYRQSSVSAKKKRNRVFHSKNKPYNEYYC